MSDEEARERLGFGNTQGELSHLEIAVHSLMLIPNGAPGKKGAGIASYAKKMGLQASNLSLYRKAALVFIKVRNAGTSYEY